MKWQVRSEIHRAGPSRAVISPSMQDEVHQRRDHDTSRHVLPQETHSRLMLACRRAMQELAKGVKQQQEKIDCLLLELEATKKAPQDSLKQGEFREARRTYPQERTAGQRSRSHRQE
ncbi:hypothetical protein AAC387_Pa01g2033 [Persea americana]